MPFYPYLHFEGTCEEAMRFYAEIFGAGELQLMRYSEAPAGAPIPPSDLIMHAQFNAAGGTLMASDFPGGLGDPQQAVSVMVSLRGARAVFEALSDGGTVIMPFGPTFWSPGFGMLRDRFGTHWIVSEQSNGDARTDGRGDH